MPVPVFTGITSGFIIYRYKGRYYAKYHNNLKYDSYPEEPGPDLVKGIPKEGKRYTEWLTKLKTKYQNVEEASFGKESTTPILDVMTIPFEEYFSVFPLKESRDSEEFKLSPSIWPPPNTRYIEWIYTIDLDRELFSVDHEIHFPLSAIPDTWVTELKLIRGEINDDDVAFKLIPQAIDISSKPVVDETHVLLYENVNCAMLQVKVSGLNTIYEDLCFELAKRFIELNRHALKIISTWGPEDVPFKELAFGFLLLADRYSFSLIRSFSANNKNYEKGVACPTTSNFWFAGSFVYLTTHLNDDAVRKSTIGHVLELTKNCPRSNFTAFLFSIRELIIIDISEEGVKHTETLPFCDITSDSVVHNVGLLAMITHITKSRTSLANHRSQTPTSPSSLPYDILLDIVKYVDRKTTITLSATSKLLRECVERLGPKIESFQLLKYDADLKIFVAWDGDDRRRLVKIKIERYHIQLGRGQRHLRGRGGVANIFNVKIRYPGVRQQSFIPRLRVLVLNT